MALDQKKLRAAQESSLLCVSVLITALGLALLYASAYFLPYIGAKNAYYFPAVGSDILFPSLITALVLTPIFIYWLRRHLSGGARLRAATFAITTALCCIAALGVFSAAGYSAIDLALTIAGSEAAVEVTRWTRVFIVIGGLVTIGALLWTIRDNLQNTLRLLSILGYTFSTLAIARLSSYTHDAFLHESAVVVDESINRGIAPVTTGETKQFRQVVWIIFDELDFNQTLSAVGARKQPSLVPNLEALSHLGVSAVNAYSPAKDTEASIPSLLSGYPITGLEFDDRGALLLKTRSAGTRPFQETDSVFGHLPAGPKSGAILGYLHPYCRVFPSVHPCVSEPMANTGRWFDSLTFFSQPVIATARWFPSSNTLLSAGVFRAFEPMYRISEYTIAKFNQFLSLEGKSLIFIHVNLPHPPGDYAQRALGFDAPVDDRESYRRNLRIVDKMVQLTVSKLKARSQRDDILLIVSADHWHRIDSPTMAQRIPWIAWRARESIGTPLETSISTVHTAALALDFLRGNVQSQADISSWWQNKDFYPPLMPHNSKY